MNWRTLRMALMTALLALSIGAWGCSKESTDTKTETKTKETKDAHEGHDHADGESHESAASESGEAILASAEQTLCPISGEAISKDSSIEYEGKKVYFCCDGCIDKFKAEPAKYLTMLPQFGGKEDAASAEGS